MRTFEHFWMERYLCFGSALVSMRIWIQIRLPSGLCHHIWIKFLPVQETFIRPWLLWSTKYKTFFPSYTISIYVSPLPWAGSRAGQPVFERVSPGVKTMSVHETHFIRSAKRKRKKILWIFINIFLPLRDSWLWRPFSGCGTFGAGKSCSNHTNLFYIIKKVSLKN